MFPGILQQAVMPADHRDSCSLPEHGAEIPKVASLPSSPQQPTQSQANVPAFSDSSEIPNADFHCTARMCYLASWFFKEMTVFVYVQCDSAAAYDTDACKSYAGDIPAPLLPRHSAPSSSPPNFPIWCTLPYLHSSLLITHLILCRLS